MKLSGYRYIDECLMQYPALQACSDELIKGYRIIADCYKSGKKMLVCGNGGSAADSEHIVGELMKEYLIRRPISESDRSALQKAGAGNWEYIASKLQRALPAISLVSQVSLNSAYANDVSADMAYAQQVYGYGQAGDILIAISTSGYSPNIVNAAKTARAFGIVVIGLTGESGGDLKQYCDTAICVPTKMTPRVQEYHVVIYHALCAMIEQEMFGNK